MDTCTLMKIKSLLRSLLGKAAFCAVLSVLFAAASSPLFAQTAEVRYAGVFYKDAPVNNNEMYCDYSTEVLNGSGRTSSIRNSFYAILGSALFPSASGGTPFIDGSIRTTYLGYQTSVPSGMSERIANSYYSVGSKYYIPATRVSGDEEVDVYYMFVVTGYYTTNLSINVTEDDISNRSFTFGINPDSNSNKNDPWVSSALIEYDQPYPSVTPTDNSYPNHCLALCMNVYCTNKPMAQSTYSIAFPLQQVKFDIVKYYNGKNVENPEETPAIRTIDLYPDTENDSAICGSYHCPGGPTEGLTCPSPKYELVNGTCYNFGTTQSVSISNCQLGSKDNNGNYANCPNDTCPYVIFNNDGTPSNQPITFCAAWDGSYEIAGEFGKSNGDFAFRSTVSTDFPGDNIITDKIQVDVTNVHTVRSTPTVVGDITAVSAQPYTFAYRLSKDADVRVAIFDASNGDDIEYGQTTNINNLAPTQLVRTLVDWQPRIGEGMKGVDKDTQITEFDSWDGRDDNGLLLPAGNYIVAIQAKAQDEWPGVDFSRAVTRQMSLDPLKLTDIVVTGLNKKSTAYASINYVPTEASKVYWEIYTPGTSFINYVPTEASKVYWEIYTPGTSFANAGTPSNLVTDSSTPTGTGPTPVGGTLVYRSEEDRTARMNFTSKWDGLCGLNPDMTLSIPQGATYPANAVDANGNSLAGQKCTAGKVCSYHPNGCMRTYAYNETKSDGTTCNNAAGCTQTFAYGAPMPDVQRQIL